MTSIKDYVVVQGPKYFWFSDKSGCGFYQYVVSVPPNLTRKEIVYSMSNT